MHLEAWFVRTLGTVYRCVFCSLHCKYSNISVIKRMRKRVFNKNNNYCQRTLTYFIWGSIVVRLTSYFSGFNSAVLLCEIINIFTSLVDWFKTSQTGQPYSDPSANLNSENSLLLLYFITSLNLQLFLSLFLFFKLDHLLNLGIGRIFVKP